MKLPDIELVAEKVHESWMNGKLKQGITSRKAEDGEELMIPYEQLSEKQKDADRRIVKTVCEAIETCANIAPRYPWHRTENDYRGK